MMRAITRMKAWQIASYGGIEQLQLANVRLPTISKPTEVLVKVDAASVNPIDIAMINGYGSKALNLARQCLKKSDGNIEFPLTMGRDFCGVVVSKGHEVGPRLNLGDQVWGVVPVQQQGCHANYVIVDNDLVNVKPTNLSCIEAASILYAGLTAWSALWITGGLCYKTSCNQFSYNKKVLVLGGSGGVGTLAIQLAKAWNLKVIATCSGDAMETVEKLGADMVINYRENDAKSQLINEGPYDIILDCCNTGVEYVQENGCRFNTYITLNSPLLKNIDNHGFIFGNVKNLGDLIKNNIPINNKNGSVKWGYFIPSTTGINVLQKFVENKQIVPVIDQVYDFQDLPQAYKKALDGHLRGKIVIDMKNCYNEQ
ncbi:hypothetical protein PV328_002173 [Microctonus aethiopoides]|uniref:Enoyl reductase (ER) domain-containing protein n=1 Tax=Microctonus aethiopoides TaxID=144406 RepID=A0AA39FYI6_9HYME|nr:hypothetical protein PV328_002173 [Microctonus aethiopoides]